MQRQEVWFFIVDRKENRNLRLRARLWWCSIRNQSFFLFVVNFHVHSIVTRSVGLIDRQDCLSNYAFRATQIMETPNGKFKWRKRKRSAANSFPIMPFRAPIVRLFSETGRRPVTRISSRPKSMGAKKLRFT